MRWSLHSVKKDISRSNNAQLFTSHSHLKKLSTPIAIALGNHATWMPFHIHSNLKILQPQKCECVHSAASKIITASSHSPKLRAHDTTELHNNAPPITHYTSSHLYLSPPPSLSLSCLLAFSLPTNQRRQPSRQHITDI